VVGDNLWISVDKLLVKGGVVSKLESLGFLPTTNPHSYTQKEVVEVDKKAVVNCGFVSFPQLFSLVTTNTSIDIQQVVREPRGFKSLNYELGLQI
jgi:hypothetical protein